MSTQITTPAAAAGLHGGGAQLPAAGGAGRPVLELEQVTKSYPGQPPVVALAGVSLSVQRGELVAVVGPSGSGKSTLLHVMGTLDRPSSGTAQVTGFDVAGLADRELAVLRSTRIGFVFQQFFLAEHATALDNVADGLLYAGVAARERRHRAAQALARVGLAGRAGFRPPQLSGGERQRVAIARAVAWERRLLLADEPSGALDWANGQAVFGLIRAACSRGVAAVVVTHDAQLASRADRVVYLRDGQLADQAMPGRGQQSPVEAGVNG